MCRLPDRRTGGPEGALAGAEAEPHRAVGGGGLRQGQIHRRNRPGQPLIAVERCREAMVVAMEKARDMGLTNVFYIDMDVANMEEIFAPGEIDRLFINFPDPWPRKKNAKRRLTHRSFLDKYCRVVKQGGEFHFKTDNAPLFAFSLEEFAACGLETKNVTDDLHKEGVTGIMTGYEEKFHALGTPIHRCEVICKPFVLPREEKKTSEET